MRDDSLKMHKARIHIKKIKADKFTTIEHVKYLQKFCTHWITF